ncbi:MAG: metallophosphoesterase family protein [Candidatus Brocadiia bacterium]
MAKYAILSDIHANWEALVAVYRDFARVEGLRDVISLGDVVGYGPNPNEVIAGLQSLTQKGYRVRHCMGNHDGAATGRFEFIDLRQTEDLKRVAEEAGLKGIEAIARHYHDQAHRKYIPVRYNAKTSIQWTRERLSQRSRQFLATEPQDHFKLADDILCVHASPADPLFGYVTNARRAQQAYEAPLMAGIRLCFLGHTHICGLWQLAADDVVSFAGKVVVMQPPRQVDDTRLELDLDSTVTLVNVGSVGQPRDGDPRAVYALFDDDALTVELRRAPYDVAATRKKILESDLPDLLAERLGEADAQKGVVDQPEEQEA